MILFKKKLLFSFIAVLVLTTLFAFSVSAETKDADARAVEYEAVCNDNYYETIEEAILAARNGGTITLLKDINRDIYMDKYLSDENGILSQDYSFQLETNGYNIVLLSRFYFYLDNGTSLREYSYSADDGWYGLFVKWCDRNDNSVLTYVPFGSPIRLWKEDNLHIDDYYFDDTEKCWYKFVGWTETKGSGILSEEKISNESFSLEFFEEPAFTFYPVYEKIPNFDGVVDGIYINIESNVNLVYVAENNAFQNKKMKFVIEGTGISQTVDAVSKSGKYEFKFTNIDPSYFGNTIKAFVIDENGAETEMKSTSVRIYCEAVLQKYKYDKELTTLVSDLLVYGAKSQLYKNPNTPENELVTYNLSLTPSEYKQGENVFYYPDSIDKDYLFTNGYLRLYGDLNFVFEFTGSRIDKLEIIYKVFNKANTSQKYKVIGTKDIITLSENRFAVLIKDIDAFDMDKKIKLQFVYDGTTSGEELIYSVNSYIYDVVNSGSYDKYTVDLAKAIANYGKSAQAYKAKYSGAKA